MSWVTRVDADEYHGERQTAAVWKAFSVDEKDYALESASTRLEAFTFRGENIERETPRYDVPVDHSTSRVAPIPYRLKVAVFELAYYYALQGLPFGGMHAGIGDIPVIVKDLVAPFVGEPAGNRPMASSLNYE